MKLLDLKTRLRRGAIALMSATHTGLAAFGLLALAFLVVDGARFVPIHAAQAGGIALGKMKADAAPHEVAAAAIASAVPDPQQRAVADHLARRFRIAADAVDGLVGEAYVAGSATGIDPLLILAVMAVESRFNPIAESEFGARGLMQVVPRFHLDKLAEHGARRRCSTRGSTFMWARRFCVNTSAGRGASKKACSSMQAPRTIRCRDTRRR